MSKPATTLHQFSSTRFGSIEFEEEDIIEFHQGLIGFQEWTRFVIINHKEGSPFRWLQSLDRPEFAMLMIDPRSYFPDYVPKMSELDRDSIQLDEKEVFMTYTTVSIPAGHPEDMTLNLAAPLIINPANRQAIQQICSGDSYTTRQRAFPDNSSQGETAA